MPAASSRPELWKFLLTQQKTTIKTNPSPPKKGRRHELLKLWKLILNKKQQSNPPHPPPQKRWLTWTFIIHCDCEKQTNYSVIEKGRRAADKISLLKIIFKFFVYRWFTKDHLFWCLTAAYPTTTTPPPPPQKKRWEGEREGVIRLLQ